MDWFHETMHTQQYTERKPPARMAFCVDTPAGSIDQVVKAKVETETMGRPSLIIEMPI